MASFARRAGCVGAYAYIGFGVQIPLLLDYLDSQRDYRATYVAYLNLVGANLSSAAQVNLAVGREVIQ